jgi:bifunctional non-homologous end joining protein LigD
MTGSSRCLSYRRGRLTAIRFIPPSAPVLKAAPPLGPDWIHEVKFDGWRVQLRKVGNNAAVLSRNNRDLTRRFRSVRDNLLALSAHSAIIDGELVACDIDGKPDFKALMGRSANVCVWCFDLMALDGRDVRQLPLVERKAVLRELLIDAGDDTLRFSEEFADPVKLLQVSESMGLEGIVSKRAEQPYVSGGNPGWVKVKTRSWREANADRHKLFGNRRK